MGALLRNDILVCAFVAWAVAQTIKVIIHMLVMKRFDWRRAFGMGGMPSSHTSFLVALTVMVAMREGMDSTIFALSLAITAVVIYDAMGVRYQTGKQSHVLNRILHRMLVEGKPLVDNDLQELIGHTPTEVFFGAVIGLLIPLFYR
ncbi:MAG: divergent PAP2 family protein [Clostridiales bacterium]|jgi:acid phosphatase family membrane protein YuiD|nr:divergent PAP2 family protein [Clostridiales bacterium]